MENPKDDPVRTAVKLGLQDAIADPDTWIAARKAFKEYAQSEAGNITLGIFKSVGKRLLQATFIAVLIYWVSGIPGLIAWWKAGGPK